MLPAHTAAVTLLAAAGPAAAAAAAARTAAAVALGHQQAPGLSRLLHVLRGMSASHGQHITQQQLQQQQQQQRSVAHAARQLDQLSTPDAAAAAAMDDPLRHAHEQQQQQHGQQQPLVQQQHAATQYTPPSGVKKTFYKRKLPCPPATEFSSAAGRLLFAEALGQGSMTGFFKLIEQYSTQDEPAFCGLASIAMVLNALSIDPKRPWKGSWRWFHEQLLDCCLPLNTVAQEGVVLTQAACLAKCNGANVTLHRAGSFSLEQFRADVVDTCTSGEEHLVVSYTRKAFGQTGDGHFSPIGGYHSGRDLVLILDTARFKYPPHWVPLPMLFEAMAALDPTTGQSRGYLRLSANTAPDSVLFTLDMRPDGSWRGAEGFIQATAPALVQAAASSGQAAPEALLRQLVSLAPQDSVLSFIAMRFAAHSCARDRCVPHTVRQQVLQELRATPLHQAIQPLLSELQGHPPGSDQQQQLEHEEQEEASGFLSEKLTMLLLLQEPSVWGADAAWADGAQHKAWQQLLDASAVSILEGEVAYLRQQLKHLEDVLQVNGGGGSGGGAFHSSCSSCTTTEAAAPAAPAAAAAGGVSHCGTTSAGTRGLATQAGGNGSNLGGGGGAGDTGRSPTPSERYDTHGCCS